MLSLPTGMLGPSLSFSRICEDLTCLCLVTLGAGMGLD